VDLDRVHWHHEELPDGVRFTYPAESGLTFVKEIRAEPGKHHLRVRIGIENRSATEPAGRSARFLLTASEAVPAESEDRFYVEPKGVAGHVEKGAKEVARSYSGHKVAKNLYSSAARPGEITFLGGHNKYFAALLRPADMAAARTLAEVSTRPVFDGDWAAAHPAERADGYRYVAADAILELTVPQVGGQVDWEYVLYAGPKSSDHFAPGDEAFEQLLEDDLGFFDGVAGMILRLLRFLHGIFGNWGVAIIALTILVRAALFPLNRRMQTSMARHGTKMKRIQPKIDAVKERYKDEPKRLREEQAKIIQQEGAIPPLGGCLPLLIQIPIFFGLFSALRVAFDLRQQPFFGWINDLAQPDRLAPLGLDLWVVDLTYLNILPILMVVLWIGQQKVMPKPTDPQALQMHKMMMWMPIIFGLFLYDYAAGLSLYMITSSLFGIAEFTIIRKIWPLDDKEQPKKQGGSWRSSRRSRSRRR
jgi:YidC/Oxa1 family membrane protein insertase